MPDHVHMWIAIPPKHPVASVIGFSREKSAIAIARLNGEERNFTGEHFWYSSRYTFDADENALLLNEPNLAIGFASTFWGGPTHQATRSAGVSDFLIWNICEAAAQQAECGILLADNSLDFPGTIDIQVQHLLDFVLGRNEERRYHGFRRILIADGHGSNMPILDLEVFLKQQRLDPMSVDHVLD